MIGSKGSPSTVSKTVARKDAADRFVGQVGIHAFGHGDAQVFLAHFEEEFLIQVVGLSQLGELHTRNRVNSGSASWWDRAARSYLGRNARLFVAFGKLRVGSSQQRGLKLGRFALCLGCGLQFGFGATADDFILVGALLFGQQLVGLGDQRSALASSIWPGSRPSTRISTFWAAITDRLSRWTSRKISRR